MAFLRHLAAASALIASFGAAAQPLGPSGGSGASGEYARASDSPFASVAFSLFQLETFEDHLLNVLGVTADNGGVTSVVFGPTLHDSVDSDDGILDGSGLQGDSFFSGAGSVRFTFNAGVLGGLPTHAGLVWTDGGGTTSFEAFDQNGVSLGVVTAAIADGSVNGETGEDRFFGFIYSGGISAIRISNNGGGIETDHLQYGIASTAVPAIPEPGTTALMLAGLAGLGAFARKRAARR